MPTGPPSAHGVDARGVLAFLDAVEAAPGVEMHGMVLRRHGVVVAQGWWAPYTPERVHLLYSLSKTFTASAAAFAVAEGLLDLDERVVEALPDLAVGVTDERTRAMTVRHLLTMATGHTEDMVGAAWAADPDEPVRGFLGLAPPRDPGSVFTYNQPATYTLATLLQRRAGSTLTAYLRPRLLDPLGIGEVAWLQDPPGRDLGFSGLHATTDAVARLAELYLRDGVHDGVRLLPEGWVAEASRAHVDTPHEDEVDWRQGYGYQLWRSRHGYRGDGAFGQLCLVLPEQDAVLAVTGCSPDMQGLLDLVWTHLLPAMGTSPATDVRHVSVDADAALAARLGDLRLTPTAGSSTPPVPGPDAGAASDGDASGRWPVAPGGVPTVDAVSVRPDGDGWVVELHEGDAGLVVPVPGARWAVDSSGASAVSAASAASGSGGSGVPVAVSGGWQDDGTLRLTVRLLETPHRVEVTVPAVGEEASGGAEVRWVDEPLHELPLHGMRAPR